LKAKKFFIVSSFALLLFFSVFHLVKQQEKRQQRQEFVASAKIASTEFISQLHAFSTSLDSLSRFFDVSDRHSPTKFISFSQSLLDGFPYIRALEWIPIIQHNHHQQTLTTYRRYWPNFRVFDRVDGQQKVVRHDYYYPVTYINPLLGNETAHGYNLGSNSKRLQAISQAIKQGKAISTEPISLVQESNYKAVLVFKSTKEPFKHGLVLAVMEPMKILQNQLPKIFPKGVNFSLVDTRSNESFGSNINDSSMIYSQTFVFSGRPWKLLLQAKTEALRSYNPVLLALGSLALFFSLFLYVQRVIRQNIEIENQVFDRTKSAVEKEREAIEANTSKSEFVTNVSHEIRTPMTAILGYTDLLSEMENSQLQKKYLHIIKENGQFLLSLVNDLLDFSKMEAGKLELSPTHISPHKTCCEVIDLLKHRAQTKNIDFRFRAELPLPETIISDEIRVRQILINLCSNAIKFTQQGTVEISLVYDNAANALIFSVTDDGIGMTKKQMKKLFASFSQADSSITRRFGGSGMGLAISARLANILGGEILVKSKPNQGSTFSYHFPLPDKPTRFINFPPEHAAPLRQVTSSKHVYPASLLLVEDNITNQLLISTILKKMGSSVDIVSNGAEALERLLGSTAGDYDLVFMDIQMPVMDGITAVSKIRQAGLTLPIVALTANATDDARERYLNQGFTDYASKPIIKQQLVDILDSYLANKITG